MAVSAVGTAAWLMSVTTAFTTTYLPLPVPSPTTTTPPPLRCRTFEGNIISATEDDPVLTRDSFLSCVECFCEDPQYYDYDDDGEEGGLAEAVCIAGDCVAPRCVDPVVEEGECCPQCLNGENCFIRQPRPRRKLPRVIPMGRDVRKGRTQVCRCSPDELMLGEPYNTVAVCERYFPKLYNYTAITRLFYLN